MDKEVITQDRLKELFTYSKDSGYFERIKKVSGSNGLKAQDKKDDHGYFRIKIDGNQYRLHQLAFLYEYGYIPKEIDHMNRDRGDNRISNLRAVTRETNMKNKPLYRNSTTGVKGVHFHARLKKWVVQISGDGDRYKGAYKTKEEAIKVRRSYELKLGYL